jgi:epsin
MEFINNIAKDLSIDKVRNIAEDTFNSYKPKTELEERVYEVLSHKNWGASGSLMNGLADDTYDYEKFSTITKLMWQAMDSRPAAWRVVFKSVGLLEHLVKNGSERCVDDARNHSHKLRSLNNFNYFEGTVDRGSGVREKSKQIVEMLADSDRIREEREKAKTLRERFGQKQMTAEGGNSGGSGGRYEGYGNNDAPSFAGGGGSSGGGGGKKMQGFGSDDVNKGYSGRYSRDSPSVNSPTRPVASSSSLGATATRVALPEKKEKKTKKKSKKKTQSKELPAVSAAAHSIDLLSLDDPVSAPAPAAAAETGFDAFGSFQGDDNTTNNSSHNGGFDVFASTPSTAPATGAADDFDAFGSFSGASNGNNNFPSASMGISNGSAPTSGNNNFPAASMGISNGSAPTNNNIMGGGVYGNITQQQQHQPAQEEDNDDFGDFNDAEVSTNNGGGRGDAFSKLVSLDGLTSNKSTKKDPLAQPIAFNQTAAQQIESKKMSPSQGLTMNTEASFRGIDGLTNQGTASQLAGKNMQSMNRTGGQPVMSPGNGAMGASDKMSVFSNIGAPAQARPQPPQQQPIGAPGMGFLPGAGGMPTMTPAQMQQQLQMMMMMQQQQQQMGQTPTMDPAQLQKMQMQLQMMQMQQQGGHNSSMGGGGMGMQGNGSMNGMGGFSGMGN